MEMSQPIRKEKFLSRAKFSVLNALKFGKEAVYMIYL